MTQDTNVTESLHRQLEEIRQRLERQMQQNSTPRLSIPTPGTQRTATVTAPSGIVTSWKWDYTTGTWQELVDEDQQAVVADTDAMEAKLQPQHDCAKYAVDVGFMHPKLVCKYCDKEL